jgi:hypothetical protein
MIRAEFQGRPAVSNQESNFAASCGPDIGHVFGKSGVDMDDLNSEGGIFAESIHHKLHHLTLAVMRGWDMGKDDDLHAL